MKYNYPPLTVNQLALMLLTKGMIIDDLSAAEKQLSHIGYFRFKKFTHPFRITDGRGDYSFINDTFFNGIIDNYQFDGFLRVLVFEAVSHIEVALKSFLNYSMTIRYGTHWYLDSSLFTDRFITPDDRGYESNYERFIANLTKECNESRDHYVNRYKLDFDDPILPPSWMIMEILSFGTTCLLYKNILDTEVRKEIAINFDTIPNIFDSWLLSISYVRNQCAHHQKLIDRTYMFPPRIPQREGKRFLTAYAIVQTDSLYAVLCIIQNILLKLSVICHFKEILIDLIDANPQINLGKLGFTKDWENEPIWQ